MNNWERVGCLTCVRSGGSAVCEIWPGHISLFPRCIPGRGAGMRRGFQGSSGYFIWNAKKIQVVWESEVLSEEEKRPTGIWNGVRRNQGQPGTQNPGSCVWKPPNTVSAFVLCSQFVLFCCPVVVYRVAGLLSSHSWSEEAISQARVTITIYWVCTINQALCHELDTD